MDVLLFGGQSNMQGQTECLPVEPIVENAWEYRMQTDTLVPLRHPVGEDIGDLLLGAHEGYGSLLPAFCRAYIRKTGSRVVAAHVAKGATTIADWDPRGERFITAVRKMRAAIDKAGQSERVDKVLYVWLQGESDALMRTSRADYAAALIAYKNALVREIGIRKFGIIRVGYFSAAPTLDRAIMQAQEDCVRQDGDFCMLTRIAARLSRDPAYLNPAAPGHYNNIGMERLGRAAGYALARAVR